MKRRVLHKSRYLFTLAIITLFLASALPPLSAQDQACGTQVDEVEPNNSITRAQRVPFPSCTNGVLDGTDQGQFVLFFSSTTADMYRFTLMQESLVSATLSFGAGTYTAVDGESVPGAFVTFSPPASPDLWLLGLTPLRIVDFSLNGFFLFGCGDEGDVITGFCSFEGTLNDPSPDGGPEWIPSGDPLNSFLERQPLPAGNYVLAISDQAIDLIDIVNTFGLFFPFTNFVIENFPRTPYILRIGNPGVGQVNPEQLPAGTLGPAGKGIALGRMSSDLMSQLRLWNVLGKTGNLHIDANLMKVSKPQTIQVDLTTHGGNADTFYVLRRNGQSVAPVATAHRVNSRYLTTGPIEVTTGEYVVATTSQPEARYLLSVTNGRDDIPIAAIGKMLTQRDIALNKDRLAQKIRQFVH
jgi:hypothetical protein